MHHQDTVDANPVELQQYGQHLYRNGQYEKAVEFLSQALQAKPASLVGILDNRAAAYLKLSKLDLAIRDAKQMIKTDRQDERGYLRASQVLVLTNKAEKALEMYAYGLKTLREDHPKRHMLQNPHDRLLRKLDAQYRDPFHSLPLEVANMILQYLDFKQIVAILRVCKRWERFLSSVAWLWTRMDLSVTRRGKVGYPAIRSYINRSKGIIAQAVLDNIADSIIDRVLVLLSRCQKLVHLDIRVPCDGERLLEVFKNSKNLKTLLTTSEIGMTKSLFANFLKELPNLEQFQSFRPAGSLLEPLGKVSWPSRLPKLKYLSLSCTGNEIFNGRQMFHVPYYDSLYDDGSHAGKQSRLKLIFKSLPNLEHLSLHCTGNRLHLTNSHFVNFDDICFPTLRRIDLTGALISGSPTSLSASLEYIRINHCRVISTVTGGNDMLGFNAETGNQANPFEQQIDSNDQSADEHSPSLSGVRSINPHFPNLHTVILDDIMSFHLDYLSFFVENSKTLRTFEISACEGVNGVVVAAFANAGPSLENVTTLRMGSETAILPRVDDFTIEQLMGNMPSLKNLIIPWSQVTGVTIKNIIQARQLSATTNNLDEKVQLIPKPRQSYRRQQQQEENETGEEQEQLQAGESADARPHRQTRSQTSVLPHVEFLDVRGCSGISLEAINYGRKHGLKIVNC